jgi:hypothetical protein
VALRRLKKGDVRKMLTEKAGEKGPKVAEMRIKHLKRKGNTGGREKNIL